MKPVADNPILPRPRNEAEAQLCHLNALTGKMIDCGARIARQNICYSRAAVLNAYAMLPNLLWGHGPSDTTALSALSAHIAVTSAITIDMQAAIQGWADAMLANGSEQWLPLLVALPADASHCLNNVAKQYCPALWRSSR